MSQGSLPKKGQQTKANSESVTIASDQSVSGSYGNPALTIPPHDTSALSDTYSDTAAKPVDENYNQIVYPVFGFNFNGTTWDRIRGDTTSGLWVNVKVPVTAGHGKTCKVVTGTTATTFTAVSAVSGKRIKVYSLSLMTASSTAVTVTFKDGSGGSAIGTYILQAIPGTNFGVAEPSATVPSFLFATSANTLLQMALSANVDVVYNLRYFDDDAT